MKGWINAHGGREQHQASAG